MVDFIAGGILSTYLNLYVSLVLLRFLDLSYLGIGIAKDVVRDAVLSKYVKKVTLNNCYFRKILENMIFWAKNKHIPKCYQNTI